MVTGLNSQSRQYFLGVGGEQTGPYSEQDVLDKIMQRSISADALVWFEGLPDWQPVNSIELFQRAFSDVEKTLGTSAAQEPPRTMEDSPPAHVPSAQDSMGGGGDLGMDDGSPSLMSSNVTMKPIFSEAEAAFKSDEGKSSLGSRMVVMVLGIVLVGGGTDWLFFSNRRSMGAGTKIRTKRF